MLEKTSFRKLIESTLTEIGKYSESREELLMGTAAQESAFGTYRKQLGNGPALGVFQIEPATHNDCFESYLNFRHGLKEKILSVSGLKEPDSSELESNDTYSICIAFVKYYRDREPIPEPEDIEGLAKYWKRVYNSEKGAGKVEEFVKNYHKYVQ